MNKVKNITKKVKTTQKTRVFFRRYARKGIEV